VVNNAPARAKEYIVAQTVAVMCLKESSKFH
jgi:hypothetical protein